MLCQSIFLVSSSSSSSITEKKTLHFYKGKISLLKLECSSTRTSWSQLGLSKRVPSRMYHSTRYNKLGRGVKRGRCSLLLGLSLSLSTPNSRKDVFNGSYQILTRYFRFISSKTFRYCNLLYETSCIYLDY